MRCRQHRCWRSTNGAASSQPLSGLSHDDVVRGGGGAGDGAGNLDGFIEVRVCTTEARKEHAMSARRREKSWAGSVIQQVSPYQLRPFPGNPRQMSKEELEKLKRSIQQFGFVEPLVVRKQDNTIIGGHQRWEAAKALGLAAVPVVYVDLTGAQAKALNLALNKIHGEWDLPKLGELLEELRDLPDLDETLSGFDDREIETLLSELERQQLPAPWEESFDVAAEMLQAQRHAAPTRVKSGELWQLGRHRLSCGDSLAPGALEALYGEKVDLVLTDPPYGVGYRSTLAKRGRRKTAIANDAVDDFDTFLQRALPAIKSVMKRGAALYWFAGGGGGEPVLAKALLAIAQHSPSSTLSSGTRSIRAWDGDGDGHGRRSSKRAWESRVPGMAALTRATCCASPKRSPRLTIIPLPNQCRCWRRSSERPRRAEG